MPELEEKFQKLEQEPQEQKVPRRNFRGIIKWICWAMTTIGAVSLAIMMFASIADITGRYFFNKPIEGTIELVSLLVVVAGCLGLGYCQLLKGNITIDIIPNRFGRRGKAIFHICSYVISIVLCIIVTWQVSMRTHDYMIKLIGGETIILGLRLWPFMLLMTICFAWVTFIFILDLINAIGEVFKR